MSTVEDRTENTTTKDLGILVGYDGSENAEQALGWAIAEAKRTGQRLSILTAYSIPTYNSIGMEAVAVSVAEDDSVKQGAQAIADQGRTRAREAGVEAEALTAFGDATGVMRDLSERADLLVLGARGRGGFIGLLVGSTASSVPGHAQCPTVVVPKNADAATAGEREQVVVVGMDGSERGRVAALEAAERAQFRGLTLVLVCALAPINPAAVAWVPPAEAADGMKKEVQVQLDAAREWLLSHFPELEIQTRIIDGTPQRVLVSLSESVALTVVGARGGGGFMGMLLGSTSQAVLSQARGPILVVPENDDDPRLASRADFGPKDIPTL